MNTREIMNGGFAFRWEADHFFTKLNAEYHEIALRIFTVVVLAHWAEHLAQSYQVYVLNWPLKEARGVLGIPFPWLVASEFMHYSYALVMLVGIWILRRGFVGRSLFFWMISFWIQFWHHIEHAILQAQVVYGENLLGAPAPISVIQLLGLIEGPASSGFNGLLMDLPADSFRMLVFFVRRVEVHMIYNTIVFIPMVIGMYLHLFPNREEAHQAQCGCAWHGKPVTT